MNSVRVWFDGACEPRNPGGYGTWGIVIKTDDGVVTDRGYIGKGEGISNNVAEYTALIEALARVRGDGSAERVYVHGDSQLVIRQMTGQYRVNSQNIRPLWQKAQSLAAEFESVQYQWVPREQNEEADALSKREYEEHAYNDRLERARSENMKVSLQSGSTYEVKGKYTVDSDAGTCTCPDHQKRNAKCKHLFSVELHRESE